MALRHALVIISWGRGNCPLKANGRGCQIRSGLRYFCCQSFKNPPQRWYNFHLGSMVMAPRLTWTKIPQSYNTKRSTFPTETTPSLSAAHILTCLYVAYNPVTLHELGCPVCHAFSLLHTETIRRFSTQFSFVM